jgi:hypothetical protein
LCPEFQLILCAAGKPSNNKGLKMKVKIEGDKIVKAVANLDGIEIVLETATDAKEAVDLILRKAGFLKRGDFGMLKDLKVSSFQEYKTSAVDYKMVFLLEFVFEEGASADGKVQIIKDLQEFFSKV